LLLVLGRLDARIVAGGEAGLTLPHTSHRKLQSDPATFPGPLALETRWWSMGGHGWRGMVAPVRLRRVGDVGTIQLCQ